MPDAPAAAHVAEEKQLSAPKAPLAFMPSSWDDAYRIAGYLAATGLTPDALRGKRDDILYIIATGQEFGLSPIQAIREIVIIKGKPYLSALLRIGMVKNSPKCEFFRLVESDDKKATFETKRKGEGITRLTYTIEEATRQGLYGRREKDAQGRLTDKLLDDNWNKNPSLMLRRRCGSQLADEVYSDETRGSRDREDLEDERELNPPPLRGVGPTSAPPPPQDAEVVSVNERVVVSDPTSSPPKVRKLTIKEEEKPAQPDANSEAKQAVEATTMEQFESLCLKLKDCADADQVDKLSMSVEQTKLTGDQRNILGQLFKARRKALGGSGK